MLQVIWRFRAKPQKREEFRQTYRSKGSWAKLFGRSPGYQGTMLLQDDTDPSVFVVIDRWDSKDSFARFRDLFGAEYTTLDQHCTELTDEETLIGFFHDEVV